MSTPMFEIPEHVSIGVNKQGQGPVDEADPEYDRTVCWCGVLGCRKFEAREGPRP